MHVHHRHYHATSRKLAARARLHQAYSVAETPWFEWVASRLPLRAGDAVLDIGCGPGWFWAASAAVVPAGIELALADQSAGMVAEAVERCTALPFGSVTGVEANAAALPFAEGSFDVVVAMHMLYHLPDPAVAIAEMARVLKPGGTLAVTTNGVDNLRGLYQLTTVFGSEPVDPAGVAFGFDKAERLMRAAFGNVERAEHPSGLRITEPDDVFLALTSYPPGDGADDEKLAAFRAAIDGAFAAGGGVLEVEKQTGLFLSRKG